MSGVLHHLTVAWINRHIEKLAVLLFQCRGQALHVSHIRRQIRQIIHSQIKDHCCRILGVVILIYNIHDLVVAVTFQPVKSHSGLCYKLRIPYYRTACTKLSVQSCLHPDCPGIAYKNHLLIFTFP